ncbi:MAG: hypothetical protein ACR2O1_10740 [Boseongicola sp.]
MSVLGALKRLSKLGSTSYKNRKGFNTWLKSNPDGSYGQYYAHRAKARFENGIPSGKTIGRFHRIPEQRERALRFREILKNLGLRQEHVLVDYGSGSLFIGEVLMEYLNPGNYIAMDTIDHFYREALADMDPDFVASRQPTTLTISDDTLDEVRERDPDFVFSSAVLQHVPRHLIADYFSNMIHIANGGRILIHHQVASRMNSTQYSWRYTEDQLRRDAESLGCRIQFAVGKGDIAIGNNLFELIKL